MRKMILVALAATALTATPSLASTTITVEGTILMGTFNQSPFSQQATFTGISSQNAPINNASTNGFDVYALDSLSIFSGGVNYTFNGTDFNFYRAGSPYNYSGIANGFTSNVIRFDNNTGAFLSSGDNPAPRFDVTNQSGQSFTGVNGVQFTGGSGITAAITSSVPEPATWAMMIAGFGLVGGAMRRRSTKVAFA